jgi:hypothetical protein
MGIQSLLPRKRKLAVSVAILLLLTIFFALYYLYYIPYNQSRLSQYGFLLLDRIQSNIIERDGDIQKLYHNTVQQQTYHNTAQRQLDHDTAQQHKELGKKLALINPAPTIVTSPHYVLCSAANAPGKNEFEYFGKIKEWKRIYEVKLNSTGEILKLSIPVGDFLSPCFSYKKEFFESFMLAGTCEKETEIILQDAMLDISGNKYSIDTFLSSEKDKPFSRIIDINNKGTDYKMFITNFQLAGQDLILCGFVKTGTYRSKLNTIPVNLIYPIVVLFFLILIFLPFIKIFLMSNNEQMHMGDFIFAILSLFLGATMITIISIQLLLLVSSNKRVMDDLKKLSVQIENETNREVEKVYNELRFLDSAMVLERWNSLGLHVSTDKGQYRLQLSRVPGDTSAYYFFDRVSLINKDGLQIMKGQIDNPDNTQLIDVSKREYFQVFKRQEKNVAKAMAEDLMGFEPINSWTEGSFKINLSVRSIRDTDSLFVASISTRMYSLIQTVFPPGFGYCLIDAEGKILTHSEMTRNLKENFLDETGQLIQLKEAFASRQSTFLNGVMMYGKEHAVYIHPMRKIPLFLVTFYDNNYFIPVNLRILSFSLLFSACVYLVILVLILILRRKPYQSFIFSPIDYFQWIVPRSELSGFYMRVFIFISVYLALLLIAGVGYGIQRDHVVFCLTLLTPLNILFALYVFRSIEPDKMNNLSGKLPLKMILLVSSLFVLSALLYFGAKLYAEEGKYFYILFQGFVILTLGGTAIFYFKRNNPVDPEAQNSDSSGYLLKYSLCVASLVACLAAMPAGIFTWYAHSLELNQTLKKAQLHMATSLQGRKVDIRNFLQYHDSAWLPDKYEDTVLYKRGIYTIYDDTVYCAGDCDTTAIKEDAGNTSENFYLNVADWAGRSYDDPLYYPALHHHSSDGYWQWKKIKNYDSLYFLYALPSGVKVSPGSSSHGNMTIIRSKGPKRYMVIGSPAGKIMVFGIVTLLIWGLFRLIKNTAYRVFMFKFVNAQKGYLSERKLLEANGQQQKNTATPDFLSGCYDRNIYNTDPLKRIKKIGETDDYDICAYFESEYNKFHLTKSRDQAEKQEVLFLHEYEYWKAFFDNIWNKCSDEEKFLLMDLATEGLMNYKRSSAVYALLDKKLIIIRNNRLVLFSLTFRYYILKKKGTPDEIELRQKFNIQGTWSAFRTPLLLIILVVAGFIFFTQEESSRQIVALITSLTTLIPLLFKFLSGSSQQTGPVK